jgi:hypothetical protein
VTFCGAQKDLLASYKGNYPGEVPYCSATLVPHLEEKIGSKCMNLVKVEEEGLEDRRSRICKVKNIIRTSSESLRRRKRASRSQDTPVL